MELNNISKKNKAWLQAMQLKNNSIHWQLTPSALVTEALKNEEGVLTDVGALMCDTGKFTGRAPQDKFIVQDKETVDSIWWGNINQAIMPQQFDSLYAKMLQFSEKNKIYIRDAYVSTATPYQLNIRVVNTYAWHNLFCHHLFLRPTSESLAYFTPDFTIINIPDFQADPSIDGTRSANFVIINFTKKIILIGGTKYAGEMKKSIFTVLNYLLPKQHRVLSMHCAANVGAKGDSAVFFGLSGTGKTTLSADSHRQLVGDDEHGWSTQNIFNFEGGCYAKTVRLNRNQEPQIFDAVRFGTIVENTRFYPHTNTVDYTNTIVTENTRAAYPITYIQNTYPTSIAPIPKNIFFLTCDAYGVLPPIAKLNKAQAMYYFIAGYTAKVAGTEAGIKEPKTVFSACFGAPFLPLHPIQYTQMLGEKITQHNVNVWLINTGWTSGPYGTGTRIALKYTRAIINAALNGHLDQVDYQLHPLFRIAMPTSCPDIPNTLLNPVHTWKNKTTYMQQANKLAQAFLDNFQQYAALADKTIGQGAPIVNY